MAFRDDSAVFLFPLDKTAEKNGPKQQVSSLNWYFHTSILHVQNTWQDACFPGAEMDHRELLLSIKRNKNKIKKTPTKSSHIVIIHQSPVLPLLLHDNISYSGVAEWPHIRLSSHPVISSWLTSAEPEGDAEKTPQNDVTPYKKKKDWQRSPHSSSGSAVSASFSLHPSSAQPRPLHDESRTNLLTLILSPRLAQFYFSRGETAICENLDRQLYLLFSFCGPIKGEQLLHQIIWKTI